MEGLPGYDAWKTSGPPEDGYADWYDDHEDELLAGFLEKQPYEGPVKDWNDRTKRAFENYCQEEYEDSNGGQMLGEPGDE